MFAIVELLGNARASVEAFYTQWHEIGEKRNASAGFNFFSHY